MAEPIQLPQTPQGALQIDLSVIEAAAARIRPHIYKTPLIESPRLNDFLGYRLLIKAESLQHTGSFKLRGATNAVWSLGDDVRHVVAFSSGNHAQGVARAVTTRGIKATIVMPEREMPGGSASAWARPISSAMRGVSAARIQPLFAAPSRRDKSNTPPVTRSMALAIAGVLLW